nr:MAG TPA: Chromatin remodeling complex ATPase [Crassvirales sp.]
MTREEVNNLALSEIDKTKYLILELITGYGKTKVAIDLINHICDRVFRNDESSATILILVAKTVHKQTWKDEIEKWGGINSDCITIECYESFKNYENSYFDIVVADEMQHLSETRLKVLESIHIHEAFIGLSATIKRDMRDYFIHNHKAEVIKCGLKEAVEDEVLPEPTVYLLPLSLDVKSYTYKFEKVNRFGRSIVTTQKGYYDRISSLIKWYKNKYSDSGNRRMKNLWLSMAGKRLKWCAEQKEALVLSLLDKFRNYKTLTFCSGIEQSERLGKYNITSKNKASVKNLEMFNSNKIKHITACNILNEGVNLTNCRIGIFCNLNSSEIVVKQRVGRILRHKSPIIIIPYFKDTREEELVEKMIEEYSKDSIITIDNVNDIKL